MMLGLRPWRNRVRVALIFVIVGAAFVPSLAAGVHTHDAGDVLVPGRWREEYPGPHHLDVVVALGPGWVESFGSRAEVEAERVLDLAAANFEPARLHLRLAGVVRWYPPQDLSTVYPLPRELKRAHHLDGAALAVGLVAGEYGGVVDGAALVHRPYIVVRHHPNHPRRDAYVLTHELGHVLGLDHHDCRDETCFMSSHGYDPQNHWCPDHLELLKANAGYLAYSPEA